MAEKRPGIILLSKYADAVAEMPDEDAGMLLKAVYAYDAGTDIPEMTPLARVLLALIQADMREHAEQYERVCSRNRTNARKRWSKQTSEIESDACERIPKMPRGRERGSRRGRGKYICKRRSRALGYIC